MPSEGIAVVREREEKHIVLSQAIDEVGRIFASLERLQGNILGGDPENCPEPKAPRPSLRDVLEEGPKILRAKIDNCLSKIDEIHEILF